MQIQKGDKQMYRILKELVDAEGLGDSLVVIILGIGVLSAISVLFIDSFLPLELLSFFTLGLFAIVLVDITITLCVDYVTEGEKEVHFFITRHLAPKEWTDDFLPYTAFIVPNMVIATIVAWTSTLLGLFDILWYIGFFALLIGGSIYGLLYLARKTYKINRKLKNHVNDPDAHKKLKEKEDV